MTGTGVVKIENVEKGKRESWPINIDSVDKKDS